MTQTEKARAIGINHVALEVGDIDAALEFYGTFLSFVLRGRSETMAFIDLGDQFLALSKVDKQPKDAERHFGLVVDDKAVVQRKVEEMGLKVVSDRFLDFHDPWGNKIEIIGYENIQFSKTSAVLNGMGLEHLKTNASARKELEDKKMG